MRPSTNALDFQHLAAHTHERRHANILPHEQKEYCPPLDHTLLFAITSDFDPNDTTALVQIREILDPLKEAALLEEALEEGPSSGAVPANGLDAPDGNDVGSATSEPPGACPDWHADRASNSQDTDPTSISHSIEGLSLSENEKTKESHHAAYAESLEDLSTATKETRLRDMFPSLKPFTIAFSLRKSNDNFSRAVEDLLNQVFFEEGPTSDEGEGHHHGGQNGFVRKGVDGFAEDPFTHRGRKYKGKQKKQKRRLSDRRHSSLPPPLDDTTNGSTGSCWATMQSDIDFIASRTGIPYKTVSSTYHRSGATLSSTLSALLESKAPENEHEILSSNDPVLQVHAFELQEEFPTIPSEQISNLIRLTHPSTAAAHELAKALTSTPRPVPKTGGITIITRPPPLNLDSPSPPGSRHITSTSSSTAIHANPSSPLNHAQLRTSALTSASHYHTLSKSSPLMSHAAAYYASQGRLHAAHLVQQRALDADALVAAQSSRSNGELDLHGVSVADAVRIARAAVERWWEGLGDTKYAGRQGSERAFRIVTGVGRHSEGGRARIGPAVGRMLVREGWRVEVGQGSLMVTGVARGR
ncbi:MAG: hypothetical protein M1817_003172 [Caeruleum heppii]|nr:MAG: hypothetical protein M1817_003172 [Caeruleum heppii]